MLIRAALTTPITIIAVITIHGLENSHYYCCHGFFITDDTFVIPPKQTDKIALN